MAGMGKVMAALKPQLAGRADMGAVSAKVKAKLVGLTDGRAGAVPAAPPEHRLRLANGRL